MNDSWVTIGHFKGTYTCNSEYSYKNTKIITSTIYALDIEAMRFGVLIDDLHKMAYKIARDNGIE